MLNIKRLRHKLLNSNFQAPKFNLGFEICNLEFGNIRPVALTGRASDSKSEGWGFESLLACHFENLFERGENCLTG